MEVIAKHSGKFGILCGDAQTAALVTRLSNVTLKVDVTQENKGSSCGLLVGEINQNIRLEIDGLRLSGKYSPLNGAATLVVGWVNNGIVSGVVKNTDFGGDAMTGTYSKCIVSGINSGSSQTVDYSQNNTNCKKGYV